MPDAEEQPEDAGDAADESARKIAVGEQDRWMLDAIAPILTAHADDVEVEPRVQRAWEAMKIAAFERVIRIMHNDLDAEHMPPVYFRKPEEQS